MDFEGEAMDWSGARIGSGLCEDDIAEVPRDVGTGGVDFLGGAIEEATRLDCADCTGADTLPLAGTLERMEGGVGSVFPEMLVAVACLVRAIVIGEADDKGREEIGDDLTSLWPPLDACGGKAVEEPAKDARNDDLIDPVGCKGE